MHLDDPYRAPAARVALPEHDLADGEVSGWREGSVLVVLRHRPLPPRCVKCNDDAAGNMRLRRFWWTPAWVHLILLAIPLSGVLFGVVLLIWLFASIVFRRFSRHAYWLCGRHRRAQALRWTLFALVWACAMFFALSSASSAIVALALIVVLFVVAYGLQTLRVRRIEADFACFSGAGDAFLASLPPLAARNAPTPAR